MPIRRHNINIIILLSAVLAVFGNTLFNGFVWDDNLLIIGNPVFKEILPWKYFFSLFYGVEYMPIPVLSFAIDYAIWGEQAFGFHLTNLLIYLAAVIAVYHLALKIGEFFDPDNNSSGKLTTIAFMTALMYAVHPLHSEAVAFVSNRVQLLSTLFAFISCLFYLSWLRGERQIVSTAYLASLVLFICSLFSKATAITLPLVFLLFMVCDGRKKNLRQYFHLVPFFATSFIFYLLIKKAGVDSGRIEQISSSFGCSNLIIKAATALQIPLFYINKLFIPTGLSPEYDTKFKTALTDPSVLTALAILVALTCIVLALRKRHPELLVGFGWFMATLVPVLNFFSTHPIVADRYVYFPSFGLFYIIATLLAIRGMKRLILFGTLLCCWWAFVAFNQNQVWKSNITLWSHALEVSPRNLKAYIGLGEAYVQDGNYDKAIANFALMENFQPLNDYYSLYKGDTLLKKGDRQGALTEFNKSYSRNAEFVPVLYALGTTYEQLGDSVQAIKMYSAVVQHTKGFSAIKLGEPSLQAISRLLIKYRPELDAMREKVASNPADLTARGELALKLDLLYLHDEALSNYLEMERLGMKSWPLFFNMGNIYKKRENYKEAVNYYEKCLHLNPYYSDALNNLGLVYGKMHQYDRAIQTFERIIASNKQFGYAPFNLAILYLERGDKRNSLRYFQHTLDRFPEMRTNVAPYMKLLRKSDGNTTGIIEEHS